MALSLETQSRIAQLRQKVANNTITMEELKEGINLIRKDRVGAAIASTTSRTRKAAAAKKPDGDDLLAELEGL